MRPLPGSSDALATQPQSQSPRSRRCPNDDDLSAFQPAASTAPVSCFIASEADLAASDDSEGSHDRRPPFLMPKCNRLNELTSNGSRAARANLHDPASTTNSSACSSPPFGPTQTLPTSANIQPRSLTPSLSAMSAPESAISSGISSRRHSLTASSTDLGVSSAASLAAPALGEPTPQATAENTVPQLIMPSLSVPRRRPFTQAGKSLGKLKVLVVGKTGIGKTSLIRSMVQASEHIVHIDSLDGPSTGNFAEIHASTRPYQWWQADMDASISSSRRRGSLAEEVLDRNVCFVDSLVDGISTPMHEHETYVEKHMEMHLQKSMSDADLASYLSSGAGSVVDAALYMLPLTGPDTTDIECMKALQRLTNVVPLLARSDGVALDAIETYKERLRGVLALQGIRCFSFSKGSAVHQVQPPPDLYAVSSATRPDYDMIDASTLMSSEYVPPLVNTDLETLVDHLFSPDGAAWLRHSAATKCINIRREKGWGDALLSAVSCRPGGQYSALSPVLTMNPFAPRWGYGRIELSNWAQGLRQSLKAEQADRSRIVELSLGDLSSTQKLAMSRRQQQQGRQRRHTKRSSASVPHQDPLGILGIAGTIKRGGQMTLELLGSLGVLGYLASLLMQPHVDCAQHRDVVRLPKFCFPIL